MVYLAPLIGAAALLSNLALAVPRPNQDSSSYGSSSSSSSDSSNYNGGSSYDNSNSNYGSNNNYGGSSNSYGGNSNYNGNYNTPSYGSGSSNYNNYGGGYDDCVSQCIAEFGNSAYQYNPTPTSSSDDSNSSDSSSSSSSSSEGSSSSSSGGDSGSIGTNGVTHTVIVAPSAGVFRYVPFALNASVGDTVEFHWGADGHTVTHSSALAICNKTEEAPFASGLQNKGFVYRQAVNTTNTTFFYCGAPTHCQKGMFGMINPPSNLDAPTSVSGMMQSLIAQDDDLKTLANATDAKVGQDGPAATWGGNIDIGQLDPQTQALAVSNVLWTRNVLAMNAAGIWKNGSIDLSGVAANTTTLMVPVDLDRALKQADATAPPPNTTANASTPAVAGATNTSGAAPTQSNPSAAGALSPNVLVALVAIVATVFAL